MRHYFCLYIDSSHFFSPFSSWSLVSFRAQKKWQLSIEESQFHWVWSIAAPQKAVAVGLGVGEGIISHQEDRAQLLLMHPKAHADRDRKSLNPVSNFGEDPELCLWSQSYCTHASPLMFWPLSFPSFPSFTKDSHVHLHWHCPSKLTKHSINTKTAFQRVNLETAGSDFMPPLGGRAMVTEGWDFKCSPFSPSLCAIYPALN